MRRSLILIMIGLVLGLSVPLLYGGIGVFQRLASFPVSLLSMVLTMVFIGWNFNAGRLRLMLGGIRQPMSHSRALAAVMATEFAISATPAGSGGPLTYMYLLQRHGVPATTAAALYATDILMDVLVFSVALLIIMLDLIIQPEQLHLGWEITMLAGLLLVSIALVWAGSSHYRPLLLWVGKHIPKNRFSATFRRSVTRMLLRFRQALHLNFGLSRRRLLAIFTLCLGHWLIRYGILYVLIVGMDRHILLAYSFLIQMLALTAGHFTMLPGGSGGVELSFTVLLAPVLDPATLGAVLLMWRFTTYYWYLIACAPVFFHFVGKALWQLLGNGGSNKAGKAATLKS